MPDMVQQGQDNALKGGLFQSNLETVLLFTLCSAGSQGGVLDRLCIEIPCIRTQGVQRLACSHQVTLAERVPCSAAVR